MVKEIETMINVQKMVKDMEKIAKVANTIIIEMEGSILIVSINNWTMNVLGISEDL